MEQAVSLGELVVSLEDSVVYLVVPGDYQVDLVACPVVYKGDPGVFQGHLGVYQEVLVAYQGV